MRTVAAPVEGEYVRVEPRSEPGIEVNGIPATLECVRKADVRVDLVEPDAADTGDDRAFVVEHVLGPLRLCGVTAASVTGIAGEWDFSRPEHRFCYATTLGPDAVVSHPAGLPNPALARAVREVGTEPIDGEARATLSESVTRETDVGAITVSPAETGSGVSLDLEYDGARFGADVPHDGARGDVIEAITTATTPYLAPDAEVAVTHAAADVLSDVVVIGGLEDVHIEASLGGAYHAETIGIARRAREQGAVTALERPAADR
ncbi:hypothetical protein ACFQMM_10710 [Saliphagus sp. GCM10025308]